MYHAKPLPWIPEPDAFNVTPEELHEAVAALQPAPEYSRRTVESEQDKLLGIYIQPVFDGIMQHNNEPPAADEQPVYAPAKADIRGNAARKGRKVKATKPPEEVEEDDLTEMLETEEEEN